MNGLKENKVLQILLAASLVFVLFFGYMLAARDNGTFEIVDLAGDRAYLELFAFEGMGGDETGMIHFQVENGKVKQTYYPTDGEELDKILQAEKGGAGVFRKYFPKDSTGLQYDGEIETAPAADALVREITEKELETAEPGEYYNRGSRNQPYTFEGCKADKIDLYLRMRDFDKNRETRIRTGVQLTGREYHYAKWRYTDDVYSNFYEAEKTAFLRVAEVADAFYVIPAADRYGIGEAALYRIEKESMIPYEYREEDRELLYLEQEYGTAEVLCTFPVDAENRILGLTNIGMDRLLLSRTEEDTVILEVYDLNGKLLCRKDTGITSASQYEFDQIQLLEKEDSAVLWVELMREVIPEEGPEQKYYEVDGGRYFVIREDSIEILSETEPVEYLDEANGTYLKLKYEAPQNINNIVQNFWGYHIGGYDIQVIEEKTGIVLYHGKMQTDFGEDYTKMLSRVNIGQYQEPLEERELIQGSIFGDRAHLIFIRELYKTVPLHGTIKGMDWSSRRYYHTFDYYYY